MDSLNKEQGLCEYEPKPIFALKKSDATFTIIAIIASILITSIGIFNKFALGYTISSSLMMILLTFYFIKGAKLNVFPVICGVLSLFIGAIFIISTNSNIRFFGVIISIFLALSFFDGLQNGSPKGNFQTLAVLHTSAITIENVPISLKSLFTSNDGNKKKVGKVLIGLLCAVPVLIVVIPLLIASDDAFSGMMKSIFNNTFTLFLKLIAGLLFSMFVISYGFSLKYNRINKIKKGKSKGVENVYLISFLSAIGICYLLYLFSQLAYFFSAFRGFLPDGKITYAEYARKGFFEMCAIAIINLGIIFLCMLISKKKKGKMCISLKVLATFISVFTLIIISTAISKMVLYINTYGMTELRLTTSAFMIFLSIVFISVILRIYLKKINVIKTGLITAACVVLLLGSFNINSICAKYNYESYKNSTLKTIDIKELYNLGPEGIPYIIKLADNYDISVQDEAKTYLKQAYLQDYFNNMQTYTEGFTSETLKQNQKNKGFAYFNFPKARAYKELYEYIDNNPWFASECLTVQKDYDYDYDYYDYYDETQDSYY